VAIELRDHVAHGQTLGRALGKRVEGTEQLHLELTPDPREGALVRTLLGSSPAARSWSITRSTAAVSTAASTSRVGVRATEWPSSAAWTATAPMTTTCS
jgi:hypothetical protein